MLINNNQHSYKPNFGMALYMPCEKKLYNMIGKRAAMEAENARPKLEELAKDADIFITPFKIVDVKIGYKFEGLEVISNKLPKEPFLQLKKAFARFINIFRIGEQVFGDDKDFANNLIKIAKKEKAKAMNS